LIETDRRTRQAGRKARLSRRGGIGEDAFRPAQLEVRVGVRAQHRVVEPVAAADGGLRIAARIPAEPEAWRDVVLAVAEGLAIVAQAEIEGQIGPRAEAVLNEDVVDLLAELVRAFAQVEALRVPLHVGQRELLDRFRGRRVHRELAEHERAAEFRAIAARRVLRDAAAETQVVLVLCPRQCVGELRDTAADVHEA
jgi:hypothetical protein